MNNEELMLITRCILFLIGYLIGYLLAKVILLSMETQKIRRRHLLNEVKKRR